MYRWAYGGTRYISLLPGNVNRLVFLDRDGTLNEEVGYLHEESKLCILPGVPEALRKLCAAGFQLVVVTNQAGIGRGYYPEEDCRKVNAALARELGRSGAELSAFYYCPHHPENGIGMYKKECLCRKPGIGLFLQAEADFLGWPGAFTAGASDLENHFVAKMMPAGAFVANVSDWENHSMAEPTPAGAFTVGASDWENHSMAEPAPAVVFTTGASDWEKTEGYQSLMRLSADEAACLQEENRRDQRYKAFLRHCYMIGDKLNDTRAGHAFGIRSILVGSGYGREEREKARPGDFDEFFETLGEAAEWIVREERNSSLTD